MKRDHVKKFGTKPRVHHLFRVLRPIQILTKVIYFLPEWIDNKPDPFKSKSVMEFVALFFSSFVFICAASLLNYGNYAFVDSVGNASMVQAMNPLLCVIWYFMPVFIHVFLFCNSKRLPTFFSALTNCIKQNAVLHQYQVQCSKKVVIILYLAHLLVQCISAIGIILFLLDNPTARPLLTSVAIFQTGTLWYVAIMTHMFLGIYAMVGLVTADLGVGFMFYYLALRFRVFNQYSRDCSAKIQKYSCHYVTRGIPTLWQSYEDILDMLSSANSLFGPLVLANQFNPLIATAVFTYALIRTVFTMTASSVVVYASNWILCYFRTIVYNTLLSQIDYEHGKFQRSLARLAATYSELDLANNPEGTKEYATVIHLLNRVQNQDVAVSPFGLYTVTSATLCALGSTVAAYLIVLLQSNNSAT